MRDMRNLQLRLQEYADCFVDADPHKELQDICRKGLAGDKTGDMTEVALKYLSLAVLLGVEGEAHRILISRKGDIQGYCKVLGASEVRIPKPPTGLAKEMIRILRCITGLEEENGRSKLIYGLRNDQLELDMEVRKVDGTEELTLNLPMIRTH